VEHYGVGRSCLTSDALGDRAAHGDGCGELRKHAVRNELRKSRATLHNVQLAAQRALQGDDTFQLPQWLDPFGNLQLWIWPWTLERPERLDGAKAYTTTLQITDAGTWLVKIEQ
jgi:hypothetical protein